MNGVGVAHASGFSCQGCRISPPPTQPNNKYQTPKNSYQQPHTNQQSSTQPRSRPLLCVCLCCLFVLCVCRVRRRVLSVCVCCVCCLLPAACLPCVPCYLSTYLLTCVPRPACLPPPYLLPTSRPLLLLAVCPSYSRAYLSFDLFGYLSFILIFLCLFPHPSAVLPGLSPISPLVSSLSCRG